MDCSLWPMPYSLRKINCKSPLRYRISCLLFFTEICWWKGETVGRSGCSGAAAGKSQQSRRNHGNGKGSLSWITGCHEGGIFLPWGKRCRNGSEVVMKAVFEELLINLKAMGFRIRAELFWEIFNGIDQKRWAWFHWIYYRLGQISMSTIVPKLCPSRSNISKWFQTKPKIEWKI